MLFIDHYREGDYAVTKPRIAVHKHNWKIHQHSVFWFNLRVGIEKVVVRKSGEELYSKTYQSLNFTAENALKPNLHYGRQDTTRSDARTSFDHSDKHGGRYRETCCGEIGFRIQGLPHWAVQEHDHIRKKKKNSSEVDSPVRESPEQK